MEFLRAGGIGFSSLPAWNGGRTNKSEVNKSAQILWAEQEYLDIVEQRWARTQSDRIPSLFRLSIRCISHNSSRFSPADILLLPSPIQDDIMEEMLVAGGANRAGDCLDLFCCDKTERLNVPVCDAISDLSIRRIAQNCGPSLKSLNLKGFIHLKDSSLEQLGIYCPSLQELDISYAMNVTNRGIATLVKCCPDLRKLCLLQCGKVTSTAIKQIAKHCKQIESLELSGTQFCEEVLLMLLSCCHHLKNIGIFHRQYTKDSLAQFVAATLVSFSSALDSKRVGDSFWGETSSYYEEVCFDTAHGPWYL